MKLNAKREKACQAYMLNGGNKSSAYCEAYPTSRKRKNETVNVRACELFNDSKVLVRVEELEKQARQMKPGTVFSKASLLLKKGKVGARLPQGSKSSWVKLGNY